MIEAPIANRRIPGNLKMRDANIPSKSVVGRHNVMVIAETMITVTIEMVEAEIIVAETNKHILSSQLAVNVLIKFAISTLDATEKTVITPTMIPGDFMIIPGNNEFSHLRNLSMMMITTLSTRTSTINKKCRKKSKRTSKSANKLIAERRITYLGNRTIVNGAQLVTRNTATGIIPLLSSTTRILPKRKINTKK